MKLRLFIGLTAPEAWKCAIENWRREIEPRFSRNFGRWTKPENLHLTLRFFGNVEEADVLKICERVQDAASNTNSFSVTPGPLGCFPNASRPRILWLGLRGETETLVQLESAVRVQTKSFGQPPEDRPFHPHLTLLRASQPSPEDRSALSELLRMSIPLDVGPWNITAVELIRSELRAGGSVYTTLAKVPLGAR